MNKSQNPFVMVMPWAFLTCLKNGSPLLTESSTRVIFILQEVALFMCSSTEGQHRFLVAPGTLSVPTSSQSNPFSCLRARDGRDLSFTCCKVFTSKASKDVAQSLEINTLERKCIKAVFNGFPSFTTSHEGLQISISTGTQSSRCDQKFCPDAVRCLP